MKLAFLAPSNMGEMSEYVKKIDKKLIFCDFDELGKILSSFDANEYSLGRLRSVYERFFSPEAYYRCYIELIRRDSS
jgi:hypothetical protein